MGKASMKGQVTYALKLVDKTGYGKKDYRKATNGHKAIHSHSWREEAMSVSQQFGTWLKNDRGRKDLYHATRSDYRAYIAHKESQGVSKGHLANIETGLRTLASGMNAQNSQRGFAPRNWVPKERIVHNYDKEKPNDRSYTPREVERVREQLPTSRGDHHLNAIDLQNAFGVRLKEASKTTPAYIDDRGDKGVYWVASEDKTADNKAHGVTKGGKPRESQCRPEYEQKVREMVAGRGEKEYLTAKYSTTKDAYDKAADKAGIENFTGSHGFRHSYARAELERKLEENNISAEGKEVIEQMFENRENGLRRDHGIEREIYNEVWNVINEVHENLGHGKGRIDLVEVYMR